MAEIHICIKCEGDDLPTPDEMTRRFELEDALLAEGVGEIIDAGGGAGVMDVYVEVADEAAALARIQQIVERMGLAERAEITAVRPLVH